MPARILDIAECGRLALRLAAKKNPATPKESPFSVVYLLDMLDDDGDHGLARRAAEGDRGAFETLLERHYDRIFRLAWRLLGDRAEAEDLAQDICVALAAKIRGFRGEARFATWLYRVVVNAARDAWRKRSRRDAAHQDFAEVDALRQAGDAARAEQAEWLRAALGALKADLRETAVLVLDEGLTHGAAAEVLQVREATVSWRMSEIKKALKSQSGLSEGLAT